MRVFNFLKPNPRRYDYDPLYNVGGGWLVAAFLGLLLLGWLAVKYVPTIQKEGGVFEPTTISVIKADFSRVVTQVAAAVRK